MLDKIQHQLLADKLKGHSHNLSIWQYAEAQEHFDAELYWIVTETIESFRLNHINFDDSGYFRPRDLFQVVVNQVAKIIIERFGLPLGSSVSIDPRSTLELVCLAYKKLDRKFNDMFSLVNEFLIYIVSDVILQIKYVTRFDKSNDANYYRRHR